MVCCPAHEDRSPSLSIRFDGDKPLFHCFAGCEFLDILGSVGLSADDVNGDRPKYHAKKPTVNPRELLKSMAFDALRAGLIAARLGNGHPMAEDDKQALISISGAFQRAVLMIGEHG
jgi:hypothetical protein